MNGTKVKAPPNWQTTVQHPTMPMLDTRYWSMPDPMTPSAKGDGKPLVDPRISNNHKGPGD